MLQRGLTFTRYVVFVAVVAALAASVALILYQAAVVAEVIVEAVRQGGLFPKSGKALAVGLIEAMDVFLIAIVALVIGLGLHRLFVDETLPLPRWLKIDDLEDLKGYLVSIVIAVLAVLFLRQAVELAGDLDLLKLSAALALMIAALVLFLLSSGAQMEGEYFSRASFNLTRAFSRDLGPEGKRSTYGGRWRPRGRVYIRQNPRV